eukprot:820099-Rhodomonas_salina.1
MADGVSAVLSSRMESRTSRRLRRRQPGHYPHSLTLCPYPFYGLLLPSGSDIAYGPRSGCAVLTQRMVLRGYAVLTSVWCYQDGVCAGA